MFRKIDFTGYRPEKPLLVWDGECKFCQYWILRLRPVFETNLEIEPYQKLSARRTGISEADYRQAARLIDSDGKVYSGPAVFYRAVENKWAKRLLKLYERNLTFQRVNDLAYQLIADHRGRFFELTKLLWGKNPRRPGRNWIFLLLVFLIAFVLRPSRK
jgi:predicted DCC family thiol-disulfide oxidoreductase YuxK